MHWRLQFRQPPNKALQLTPEPLRGPGSLRAARSGAAELSR